jgi:hypothetical protein
VKEPKVICLGWHKTGTSTMGLALLQLGYKVVGARLDTVDDLVAGRADRVVDLAREFDGFQDVPWAALYRELDEAFPGSKFILVERDEERWLHSAKTHFADAQIPMHEWLYGEGVLEGNEALYLERYRRHYAEVRDYFSDRQDDILDFSLERDDGWEKLCRFLDAPIPASAFPHENKGAHSFNARDRIVDAARRAVPLTVRRRLFGLRLRLRQLRGLPDPRDRFHNLEASQSNRGRRPGS